MVPIILTSQMQLKQLVHRLGLYSERAEGFELYWFISDITNLQIRSHWEPLTSHKSVYTAMAHLADVLPVVVQLE